MSKIDEYFDSLQKQLELRFSRMRTQNSDSEAKGVASEMILGKLLEPYLQPTWVTYRRQIIDSNGKASDEVDVAFCNLSQLLIDTELLLAEGVDYAFQIKSVMTDHELDRLLKNAQSVKQLDREGGIGDLCYCDELKKKHFLDRVPYIGVAYESQLTYDTLYERIISKCTTIEPHLQPDALFVIGCGSFVNSRGIFSNAQDKIMGWIGINEPLTVLLEIINFLIGIIPRPLRVGRALAPYLKNSKSRIKQAPPDRGLPVKVYNRVKKS